MVVRQHNALKSVSEGNGAHSLIYYQKKADNIRKERSLTVFLVPEYVFQTMGEALREFHVFEGMTEYSYRLIGSMKDSLKAACRINDAIKENAQIRPSEIERQLKFYSDRGYNDDPDRSEYNVIVSHLNVDDLLDFSTSFFGSDEDVSLSMHLVDMLDQKTDWRYIRDWESEDLSLLTDDQEAGHD